MKPGYTTIMHEPRIALGLNMNQYAVLDLVYHLSTNPTAPVPGWCSMTKQHIGEFMGLDRKTITRICNGLEDEGYLEKSEDGRLLKTTMRWVQSVVNYEFKKQDKSDAPDRDKMSHDVGQNVPPDRDKMSHYNNSNNNKQLTGGISSEIKKEFPILYSTLFESPSYRQRVIKMLKEENHKADFHSQVVPVINKWLKNNWTAGNLNRPAGQLAAKCSSYVLSVFNSGGAQDGNQQNNGGFSGPQLMG